jgi:hypothetical protein
VSLEQFQAQRQLAINPRYRSAETGFEVYAGGRVVARVTQPYDRPRRTRPPFTILAGDEPVGLVVGLGPWGAFDVRQPDGTVVGTVRGFPKGLRPARWEIHQLSAPVLTGSFHGTIRKLLRILSTGLTLPTDYVLPYEYRFTADGRPALRIRRGPGLRGRLAADVDAPWLDRRLVLAQALAMSRFQQSNLRSDLRSAGAPLRSETG